MSRSYDILLDFNESSDSPPDEISVTATAVIAVWRYKYPATYSRSAGTSSPSIDMVESMKLRNPPLIIVEDVQQLSTSTNKSNHISQLHGVLLPGANYMTEMFPGDWVAAWMVNDENKVRDIVRRIRDGDACNKFSDGFKFLGRLTSIRKRIVQNPGGVKTSNYLINAGGFQELDASIYYEPGIAGGIGGSATQFMQQTGIQINDLIHRQTRNGGLLGHELLPFFMSVFYGYGAQANLGFDTALRTTAGMDNPDAFIIPSPIKNLLGVDIGTKRGGAAGFNDICNLVYGIQDYGAELTAALDNKNLDVFLGRLFNPDSIVAVDVDGVPHRLLNCRKKLLGEFLPALPQFNGQKTVWAILQQFLNPAVNEMYSTLRTSPTGEVLPTVIARQLPFTTGILSDKFYPDKWKIQKQNSQSSIKNHPGEANQQLLEHQIDFTRFSELPRWKIHPILIKSVDLGRSDSMRFNFVHINSEESIPGGTNQIKQFVRDPPVRDDFDIARSGLRPYLITVICGASDVRERKAGDWMYILSDILMGQHLALTGSLELVGVQSPICIGDNIEYDGHILHIEAVTHSYQNVVSTGQRIFSTTLALSHGLKGDQLNGSDFSLYSGTEVDDLRTREAKNTRDYSIVPTEPQSPPSGLSDSVTLTGSK